MIEVGPPHGHATLREVREPVGEARRRDDRLRSGGEDVREDAAPEVSRCSRHEKSAVACHVLSTSRSRRRGRTARRMVLTAFAPATKKGDEERSRAEITRGAGRSVAPRSASARLRVLRRAALAAGSRRCEMQREHRGVDGRERSTTHPRGFSLLATLRWNWSRKGKRRRRRYRRNHS